MKKSLLIVLFILAGIQFISIERSNPVTNSDTIIFPNDRIQNSVKKACYDCHSNETKWPWYSYVAPVSWLIENHVIKGRKEVNFSIFKKYTLKRKIKKFEEIFEEIEDDKMPLSAYIWLHSNAKLDSLEKERLLLWAKDKKEKYIRERDSLIRDN